MDATHRVASRPASDQRSIIKTPSSARSAAPVFINHRQFLQTGPPQQRWPRFPPGAPNPDYSWALFIYDDKGTLKADTIQADFVPLDKRAPPLPFEYVDEPDKYPEDVTVKDTELNAAPATRRHLLDFLEMVAKRSRTFADIEQGHISTASCILANMAMDLGRPLVYDPKKRLVVDDREATRRLTRAYRKPWKHPAA